MDFLGFVRHDTRLIHVETVCLLSKLSEAKHSIDVKLNMDELDVTTAETKATYEEIQGK